MPRVRLVNTFFHSIKMNTKLMLNLKTKFFSYFFLNLANIVSTNLSFLPFL